jgi:UDPglucose 6-dehydrogenase
LVTVQGLAHEFGTEAGTVDAWQRNSAHSKSWALRVLQRELLGSKPAPRIAVWGLAYKQDTVSVKNSASLELIRTLTGCKFHAYDPAARVDGVMFPNLTVHPSAVDAVANADALAIMTPWKVFSTISPAAVAAILGGRLIVDPHGMLEHRACGAAGLRHFQLGRPK